MTVLDRRIDEGKSMVWKWLQDNEKCDEQHEDNYQVEELSASAGPQHCRLYPPYNVPTSAAFWLRAGNSSAAKAGVVYHLRYFKHELVDLSISPKDYTGVVKPGCEKKFKLILEPGYDPIGNHDDGVSITVFFADADLAQWYNKKTRSNRWWETMPRHEVKLSRVEFVMMDDITSDRILPRLWNNPGGPIDLVTQARASVSRSTSSYNSNNSVAANPNDQRMEECPEAVIRRVTSELRTHQESMNAAFGTEMERLRVAKQFWITHVEPNTSDGHCEEHGQTNARLNDNPDRLAYLQQTSSSVDIGSLLKFSMEVLENARNVLTHTRLLSGLQQH